MKSLRLVFEETSLLDLRKTLFRKGLTPQQFFTFVTNLAITNDSRILQIINEACEAKADLPSTTKYKELNAEEIYSLIESYDANT